MSAITKRFFASLYILIYLGTLVIVLMTQYMEQHKDLLYLVTKENSFYELGSVFTLLVIAVTSIRIATSQTFQSFKSAKIGVTLFGLLAILAALEEISWGQHIFGFESGETFKEYNRQGETNLHNFIHPVAFALTQNLSVYLLFVYIPIFLKIKTKYSSKTILSIPLHVLTPSIQNILVFCYAMSFQAYFLLDTYSDTLLLVLALAGVLYCIKKNPSDRLYYVHWALVILSAATYMLCHKVLRYENMQYEIREMIYCLGILMWLVESDQRLKEYQLKN